MVKYKKKTSSELVLELRNKGIQAALCIRPEKIQHKGC